jgi:hypothetical protein
VNWVFVPFLGVLEKDDSTIWLGQQQPRVALIEGKILMEHKCITGTSLNVSGGMVA